MGFPGSYNYQKIYQNSIEDVAQFLDEMHGSHYHVYNLCAEKSYPPSYFHGRVTRYRIDDFNPPPIEMIKEFCEDVDRWLSLDRRNVVAVHCQAGKGRTGTMICSFLLYKRMFNNAERAIEFFESKRMLPGLRAMHPSQMRYVRYFNRLVRERFIYAAKPLMLLAVEFSECPVVNGLLSSPYFRVKQRGVSLSYKSKVYKADSGARPLFMELARPVRVAGDVRLEFFDGKGAAKVFLFWTWINTYFVSSSTSSALPSGGPAMNGPPPDQWRPLASRAGARHDGSDPGRRCIRSVMAVGDGGETTGFGGGGGGSGGGRCITISLPKSELDRLGHWTLDGMVRPDFMVKLYFGTLPGGA